MLITKHKKGSKSGGNRLLISITVVGSAGPIRFVVNEEMMVATVVDTALKSYAREGRLPVLGSNSNDFVLYCPVVGTEEAEMSKRLKEGTYKGKKFTPICHFMGYQARGSLPSKFDCDYAYVLGHICYHILSAGLNGYMATVTNLEESLEHWRCGAAPITAMMSVKDYGRASGSMTIGKPVVHHATVDLRGKVYELLKQNAAKFLMEDVYRNPGPLQFDGPGADSRTVSLLIQDLDYMGRIKELNVYLDKVRSIVKPGCSQDILKATLSAMSSATDILSVTSSPTNGII